MLDIDWERSEREWIWISLCNRLTGLINLVCMQYI